MRKRTIRKRKPLRGHYGAAVRAVTKLRDEKAEANASQAYDAVRWQLKSAMTRDDIDGELLQEVRDAIDEDADEIVELNVLLVAMTHRHLELVGATTAALEDASPELIDQLHDIPSLWKWLGINPDADDDDTRWVENRRRRIHREDRNNG